MASKDSHIVVRGEIRPDDFNDLINEGRYYFRNIAWNTPNFPGVIFGILDVSKTPANQYVQMVYPTDGTLAKPRYRHRTSTGVWMEWQELGGR